MHNDVSALLEAMKKELQALALWETTPPSKAALSSDTPFCIDTLTMTQWLQWVFIPRIHAITGHKGSLPKGSNMADYAEEAFFVDGIGSTKLLDLIKQFDHLMR